jgi:hypothetical protein
MLFSHDFENGHTTRANEICEPLGDSLLARHNKSFGQRSGNTSDIGPTRISRHVRFCAGVGAQRTLISGSDFERSDVVLRTATPGHDDEKVF